jgi:hypothetical protein
MRFGAIRGPINHEPWQPLDELELSQLDGDVVYLSDTDSEASRAAFVERLRVSHPLLFGRRTADQTKTTTNTVQPGESR